MGIIRNYLKMENNIDLTTAKENIAKMDKVNLNNLIKSPNPSATKRCVPQAVAIILKPKLEKMPDPKTHKKVVDWWATCLNMMKDMDAFIKKIQDYDCKTMDEKDYKQLVKFFDDHPEFTAAAVKKSCCFVSMALFAWVQVVKAEYEANSK